MIWKKRPISKIRGRYGQKDDFLKTLMFNVFLQIVVNHYFWMKISIKILSHLIKNWTEDPLVDRNEIVSSYYYYFFPFSCKTDFSEMAGRIFLKFSGMIENQNTLRRFFHFFKIHFRSSDLSDFRFFQNNFV